MIRFALFIYLTLVAYTTVSATPACTPINQDLQVRATLASAGFFANLRNADHSVRSRMEQLLRESEESAARLTEVEALCSRSCPQAVVAVVFQSTPHMTLSDYDDRDRCEDLFSRTRQQPIEFLNRTFDSQDEVEDWYKDLTRGDGDDGESLYDRCPGRCSPRYSSLIFKRGEKFVISTSVVCGHARDKDDDQYALRAAVRWICP